MRRRIPLLVLAGALLLFGCGGEVDDDFEKVPSSSTGASTGLGFYANFDLTAGKIPTATDLLLSGTQDGTLNIPVDDPADFSNPRVAINALDGFSTVAPITTTFASAIDASTLTPATVRVFQVALTGIGGAVTEVNRELTFGVEFLATLSSLDATGSTLVILPLAPLAPRTSYLVALTDGIKSVDGRTAMSTDYYFIPKTTPHSLVGSLYAGLEPVRQLVQAQEGALAAFGMDPGPVVLSWVFTTQSVGNVLSTVRAVTQAAEPAASTLVDSGADSPFGAADMFVGTLEVPYYLTAAASANDPTPLGTWWKAANPAYAGDEERNLTAYNPLPAATSLETIPLLASVPKGAKPEGGWPVVIYQHGLAINRTSLLAIADSLAAAGFAAVAIDLPMHGVTGDETNGTAAFRMAGFERTFDLDLVNNATGAPGPDGTIDATGTHYLNLASLLTTRDQGRQATADLLVLNKALEAMDYDGGGADFDTSEVYFVGYSLGAVAGANFLALESKVKAAVLALSSGGLGKTFDGSINYGPRLAAGLAAKGVVRGTADFESFIGALQTVLDPIDPLNYAALTGANRGVLLFEVLGDAVLPNNVYADAPAGVVPSPTAGTDPLAFFMGLTQFSESAPGTPGTAVDAWIRFTSGDHGSPLSPAADPLVTTVMQTAMATFLATDGVTINIADDSVVEQ